MRLNIKIFISVLLFVVISTQVIAQSCERKVLSSAGCSGTTPQGNYVSWTLGQPLYGCSIGNDVIVRQGFEQPQDDNCVSVSMAYELISDTCDNAYSFEFTGDGEGVTNFYWDFGTEASPSFSVDQNPSGISFNATGTMSVTLTVSTADCESTASNILNIEESGFGALATITPMYCELDTKGAISIVPFGGDNNYTYSWSTGSTEQNISDLLPGDYTLTLTDGSSCQKEIVYTVEGPATFLDITADVRFETCKNVNDGFIDLVIQGGKAPYNTVWQDNTIGTHIEELSEGNYDVTVTDANNCSVSTTINVGVYCTGIVISNTFTPNGDGANDIWNIEGIEFFPNNEVRVYNRWGGLMYQKVGFMGQWAGTDNSGKDLATGAYYYVVELNDADNSIYKGSITIIR